MKNLYLLFTALLLSASVASAQTLLHSNGPLINAPGQGAGGANVSQLHSGILNFGFNQNWNAFQLADDFVIPGGQTWKIDSIIFFGYQTQVAPGGSTSSTFAGIYFRIFDGDPSAGAPILFGNMTTNVFADCYWSGIWRTSSTAITNTQRGIMRIVADVSFMGAGMLTLQGGKTYWLNWSAQGDGSNTSGPWTPPITTSSTITGNGKQYVHSTSTWQNVIDTIGAGTSDDAPQGFPFELWGSVISGVDEQDGLQGITDIYPSPARSQVSFVYHAKQGGAAEVSVTDETGRVVSVRQFEAISGDNRITLDVSQQSAGVYFIQVKSGGSTSASRFVKY